MCACTVVALTKLDRKKLREYPSGRVYIWSIRVVVSGLEQLDPGLRHSAVSLKLSTEPMC